MMKLTVAFHNFANAPKNQSIYFGLTANEQKTKYLWRSKKIFGLYDRDSKCLEQVESYKHLRSIVNGNNSIEEEIKALILAI
jgi:hypothetical protein